MSGGSIELKFFAYKTIKKNLSAYLKYINGWTLMPFWSLGFQISRWGLEDSDQWSQVWKKANENQINFDVLYADIDYMIDDEDFTVSPKYDPKTLKNVTNL